MVKLNQLCLPTGFSMKKKVKTVGGGNNKNNFNAGGDGEKKKEKDPSKIQDRVQQKTKKQNTESNDGGITKYDDSVDKKVDEFIARHRKQKIVIQVSLMNGNKSRKRAMQIAVEVPGVDTVSFKDEESQMEVTGELDAVSLTRLLRKKVGHADLLSVSPARGEKKEDNKPTESDDDNNGGGGGDDDNNGGGGGKNNKKGSDGDGDGNGDKYRSDHDSDSGGEMKGKNMDFMGNVGFGYRYGYHAGNENEYPVGQLQCAQEVQSSNSKCLFYHAIMIS